MRRSILLTCFTILISTFGSAQQIKRNLIANSCFEEGLKHWYTTCEPNINVNYYIDKDTPISGSASALISVDQPGSHSHDAMLYVLFPVEKNAKYKICFKAMCSRKEQLKLEFCSDHGDYIPPVIEIRPESFKSEYDDDRLKGSISVTSEVREYTFITGPLDKADWKYKLAFQFATAAPYTLYWIDDVKICRADDGDWDGNLFPADESGRTSFPIKGTSSNLVIPYCPNEETAYDLTFTLQSNRKTELHTPMIPIYGNYHTINFDNEPENRIMTCLFHQRTPPNQVVSPRIERIGCWNILLSNIKSDAGDFNALIKHITVKEQNLRLLDCEILNPISELLLGTKHQFRIGEFVTPTHASPSVVFGVQNGQGCATIDQQGVLTGTSPGDITVKVCNREGDIIRAIPIIITTPVSTGKTQKETVQLYPTIVRQGEDIYISGSTEESRISLYSITGQMIFFDRHNLHTIQTYSLHPGVYIARIIHNQNISIQKIRIK